MEVTNKVHVMRRESIEGLQIRSDHLNKPTHINYYESLKINLNSRIFK